MKLTNPLRHMQFGNLGVYMRGLVYYSLSPYHLKAFPGVMNRLPRTFQRCFDVAVYVVPCALAAYSIHEYVEKKFDQMNRKNPEDYVNDN